MNKCVICGQEKQMYYVEWCPKCDKPQIQNEPHLNFVQCLRYLEANGHSGIVDRLWSYYMDSIQNDTSFILNFPDEEAREDIDDEKILADIDLVKTTWNIQTDYIYMDVSW